jgi:integrase
MARKNESKYRSKNYPNLYRYPTSPYWVFRKYSSQKGKEFVFPTGEAKNEAKAYKLGVEAYNKWLGQLHISGRVPLIRDIAEAVLESKARRKPHTARTVRNQIRNHIIPEFGHLRPDQITQLRWEQYDADSRGRTYKKDNGVTYKRTKLYNTRKALIEILRKAKGMGLIRDVPELLNNDAPAAGPEYLSNHTVRKILHEASPAIKLLAFIMWKQGARPGEVLQYRWDMIRWDDGPHGKIRIPGEITKTNRPRTIPLNSRVSRVLRYLHQRRESPYLFPSSLGPDRHQTHYRWGWDRTCVRAEVKATIYNLRDTFISNSLMRGLSSTFIAKYCDTSAHMIDKKYAVAVDQVMERVAE